MIHLEFVDRTHSVQTVPVVCMHCEQPTCAEVCPADAIKRTGDGVVQSARKPRCIACGNCVVACPFGVPEVYEDRKIMMKCDMCYDRSSVGKVACADCHMPYQREGALKVSDHHVRSPLLNINRACQTCHKWPEEELKARAELLQERVFSLRDRAMDALVALIGDIKAAQGNGTAAPQLEQARQFQRTAQFLLDFVEAENSIGFHAPEEAERVLAVSIDNARQGQLALFRRGSAPAAGRPAPNQAASEDSLTDRQGS